MAFNVNVMEAVGSLAAGAALEYFVERKYTGSTDQNTATLIEAGVAVAGLLGADYVPRQYQDALTGVAAGSLGLLGARLSKQFIKASPSSGGTPTSYHVQPSYSYQPVFVPRPSVSVASSGTFGKSVLDL